VKRALGSYGHDFPCGACFTAFNCGKRKGNGAAASVNFGLSRHFPFLKCARAGREWIVILYNVRIVIACSGTKFEVVRVTKVKPVRVTKLKPVRVTNVKPVRVTYSQPKVSELPPSQFIF